MYSIDSKQNLSGLMWNEILCGRCKCSSFSDLLGRNPVMMLKQYNVRRTTLDMSNTFFFPPSRYRYRVFLVSFHSCTLPMYECVFIDIGF